MTAHDVTLSPLLIRAPALAPPTAPHADEQHAYTQNGIRPSLRDQDRTQPRDLAPQRRRGQGRRDHPDQRAHQGGRRVRPVHARRHHRQERLRRRPRRVHGDVLRADPGVHQELRPVQGKGRRRRVRRRRERRVRDEGVEGAARAPGNPDPLYCGRPGRVRRRARDALRRVRAARRAALQALRGGDGGRDDHVPRGRAGPGRGHRHRGRQDPGLALNQARASRYAGRGEEGFARRPGPRQAQRYRLRTTGTWIPCARDQNTRGGRGAVRRGCLCPPHPGASAFKQSPGCPGARSDTTPCTGHPPSHASECFWTLPPAPCPCARDGPLPPKAHLQTGREGHPLAGIAQRQRPRPPFRGPRSAHAVAARRRTTPRPSERESDTPTSASIAARDERYHDRPPSVRRGRTVKHAPTHSAPPTQGPFPSAEERPFRPHPFS
ncbi:hypothetical protein C2E23DRAFT_463300 [Lenzites betulinus]|nr:hypothetical protein C2E23DRAFT_463300 [Lenzites betulinus]